MAFTSRALRVLCKIYHGNTSATYCIVRQPSVRMSFARTAQKYCYSTETNRPKITENLTNIQSATFGATHKTLGQENDKQSSQKDDVEGEKKETAEEKERRKRMTTYSIASFGIITGFAFVYVVYKFGLPDYDEHGNVIEDEFTNLPFLEQTYKRLRNEFNYVTKLLQEPSREKLLPDPLEYPYIQPPYTLVLEMTDVLVHPDWTYQTGWRFKKRPGVDQFLEAVAPPQFEIVVYTAEQGMTVFPILDALDPHGYIMYRLVRDATRFVNGHHVKDLDALNRDLRKVIVVDWNAESVKFHPENTLKLPRWTGNDDDTTLYDLAAFLKTILATNVDDVRDVLLYYKQFDNPLEAFRENQRKLLLQMEEDENKAQLESNKVLTSKWKPSFLRNH